MINIVISTTGLGVLVLLATQQLSTIQNVSDVVGTKHGATDTG